MIKSRIVSFIILVFLALGVNAQININNLKNIEVDDLTDSQVAMLKKRIERDNLSDEQVVSLATMKGMPYSQIEKLMIRLAEDKPSPSGANSEISTRVDTTFLINGKETKTKGYRSPEIILTSKEEKVFGNYLFSSTNVSFELDENNVLPKDYKINYGDELVVEIWGNSLKTYTVIVDASGGVRLENLSPIFVKGLDVYTAESKIKQKLATLYGDLNGNGSGTQLSLSILKTHPLSIHIIGEVNYPGTYKLPTNSKIINALYRSGGPNINGSMREIEVLRNNKLFAKYDVYNMLLNSDISDNIDLENGDIIRIPALKKRIEIKGEVIREGFFELKENETLADLFKYAGGFTGDALKEKVSVRRLSPLGVSVIDVIPVGFQGFIVENGDKILVRSMITYTNNKVSIHGEVNYPGNYEYVEGITLMDLLNKAEGLTKRAYTKQAHLYRSSDDVNSTMIVIDLNDVLNGSTNIDLRIGDAVHIISRAKLYEKSFVKVVGEVNNPKIIEYRDSLTLESVLLLTGGLKLSSFGGQIEVSRRIYGGGSKKGNIAEVFTIPVQADLSLPKEFFNFLLMPFDEIVIRKASDYHYQKYVKILGEVTHPGSYCITKRDERISDLLARSGSFTDFAYLEGARLSRRISVSGREKIEKSMILDNEYIDDDLLNQSIEFISIDLQEIVRNPKSKSNLILMPGDELVIPKKIETVRVSGELLHPSSMRFTAKKRLRYYLSNSGGVRGTAHRRKIFVVYNNGSAQKTRNFLGVQFYPKIRPGCEIIVPIKPERNKVPPQIYIAMASSLATFTLVILRVIDYSVEK